jgi:hypothetical protein
LNRIIWIVLSLVLAGCSDNDLSYISIRNKVSQPIYAVPYASGYCQGEWIQPGITNEFYSIYIEGLDGYDYFAFYYDSVIVFVKDHEDEPVKFYRDGTTVNYDPLMNPFTNRDVWSSHEFERHVPGNGNESSEKKRIFEYFFSIETERIISLSGSPSGMSDPAF